MDMKEFKRLQTIALAEDDKQTLIILAEIQLDILVNKIK